ncbi:carbon storage regulator CsrA [Thermodesulfitimonas autotrophica]|uniref:Translational regulator CsrA n=1 Tax=Thermodesulfitimonas autotrophica TaxID=1894989 RepID=A0A3N5BB19_9THEO|nr:carbon storage regulator CsrA [Thermodesulfitimonas autotrophica]RPF42895.1 carbon storage regulator CsrA [Thermodesulfitimonas autotrophica]
MLVLTRRRGEVITIGDAIEVTVLDIREDQVRIGIKAPKEIPVHRKEIYEAIKAENIRAASLPEVAVLKDLAAKYKRKE